MNVAVALPAAFLHVFNAFDAANFAESSNAVSVSRSTFAVAKTLPLLSTKRLLPLPLELAPVITIAFFAFARHVTILFFKVVAISSNHEHNELFEVIKTHRES